MAGLRSSSPQVCEAREESAMPEKMVDSVQRGRFHLQDTSDLLQPTEVRSPDPAAECEEGVIIIIMGVHG